MATSKKTASKSRTTKRTTTKAKAAPKTRSISTQEMINLNNMKNAVDGAQIRDDDGGSQLYRHLRQQTHAGTVSCQRSGFQEDMAHLQSRGHDRSVHRHVSTRILVISATCWTIHDACLTKQISALAIWLSRCKCRLKWTKLATTSVTCWSGLM